MIGTNVGWTPYKFFCSKASICWDMTILRSKTEQKWAIGDPPIELAKLHSSGSYFPDISQQMLYS